MFEQLGAGGMQHRSLQYKPLSARADAARVSASVAAGRNAGTAACRAATGRNQSGCKRGEFRDPAYGREHTGNADHQAEPTLGHVQLIDIQYGKLIDKLVFHVFEHVFELDQQCVGKDIQHEQREHAARGERRQEGRKEDNVQHER